MMPIKILSYNIQAGIGTQSYRKYVTQINRQLFHSKHKTNNLRNIAEFASDYDLACIQEVDLGGRRSNFECQVEQLHRMSHFEYMSTQENRIVGNISRHGNAILSKAPQSDIEDLKLPGKRAGRGAILARVEDKIPYYAVNVHLSLGMVDQMAQVEYLIEESPKNEPLIIAGDFNCRASSMPVKRLAHALDLNILTTHTEKSYPSWKPRYDYDHILVSQHFSIRKAEVKDIRLSDHRPVEAFVSH